jgi:putative tryptophan/tyrosine transport system substrate-binding protein
MRRRDFMKIIGSAAAAWPLAARAQQPIPVIGCLGAGSPSENMRAFRQGLSEAGYVEGRNVLVEYRWAEGRYERLPQLAAELVSRPVTVIFASGSTLPALAARAASATIPIVFSAGVDPIESGLVASLNRPGGNLTGVTSLITELGPKRLELLHELVPKANNVASLVNPTNPNAEPQARDQQAAARALGLQLHVLRASTEGDIETILAGLAQLRASILVIGADPLLTSWGRQLAALTVRRALPAIQGTREFAAGGGLMSYGADPIEAYRTVGVYVGRILKGEKPGDLPVQRSTKVELIVNLKTAKALGLTVPLTLLGRADEVIE